MAERIQARELVQKNGKLEKDVIAIKTGGHVVDLHSPVDANASFEVVRTTDKEGLAVIRHSTAHVMADAVQRLFPGTKVTIGPSIEDGFYYDFDRPDGHFTDEDLGKIESTMLEIIKKDTPFRREEVSRADVIEMFRKMGETYKVEIIERTPEDEVLTVYRHVEPGHEWVDFCQVPHVPSTGKLSAIKLTSVAGAYWRGD